MTSGLLFFMYLLTATEYPNNEIRLTTAKLKSPVSPWDLCDKNETKPPASTLDIGSKFDTRSESDLADVKPGWGMTPRSRVFSRRGRNTLMRAGGVFTKENMKPQEVLFLTGTLPGSTEAAFQTIADYSAFLVWHLKNWVNKHVPGKRDFYVWEHQKRGALHLHYAVHCPDKAQGEYIKKWFPRYWVGKLKEVSIASGVDLLDTGRGYSWTEVVAEKNQVAQWCEKDVSRYLAKYCSKGAAGVTRNVTGNFHSPSQWYGVSRPLLALLRKHTVTEIYYAVKRGQVLRLFEEMKAFLANLSDVCHYYISNVIGLPQCVSYNSHWNLSTLWLRTMSNRSPSQQVQSKSQKSLEWMTSYLIVVAKRYSISPAFLHTNSSPMSAQSLEKLLGYQQLSIAEAMDLIHALRWNSWYKFRSRKEPPLLEKDCQMLDDLYRKILTMRLTTGLKPDANLLSLFTEDLTGKIP